MDKTDAVFLDEFMGNDAPVTPQQWTDDEKNAAKRAADIINDARSTLDWEGLKQCWIAIRLSDGGSDMVIYETKQDAVRHQLHEQQCAYIAFRNLIGGASEKEMLRYLRFNRMAYDAGFRLPDPDAKDGGPDLPMSAPMADHMVGRRRPRR